MNPDFNMALMDVDVIVADPLRLPSGRLVAAEPPGLFPAGEVARWAFAETIAPGEYPVEVLRERGWVIAARVIVCPGPVHEWRPAKVAGRPDWEHCFFPVDGATGSFGSVEVFETLTDPEAREDLIADLSFGSGEPYITYVDEDTGLNLISFALGGDGKFETWVGYTAAGDAACFLTDYGDLCGRDDRRGARSRH
ncbi:DUF4241 domain-containing protein [Dactylosporangium sp. CA-233914]|uniref:DUF4241 domain-containing protein n=1 Tax=Dactylosporangium sp. CA-233914 TaxID=3239934 RepID=UPI003D8D8C54